MQLKLFDLLYLDGKSYLHQPYSERTERLVGAVTKGKHITLVDRIITDDLADVNAFFQKMLKEKQEGIMIKSVDSEYRYRDAGLELDQVEERVSKEMTDTFDLVVVGAFHGKGKRSGTYGALLCASYHEKEDIF